MNRVQQSNTIYEITIDGGLKGHWSSWFDGIDIRHGLNSDGTPTTILTGPICDQSALCGILIQICNLNLKLISVIRLTPEDKTDEDTDTWIERTRYL